MKRKLVTFGAVLVLGAGGLVASAAPAAAETDLCSNPTFSTTCELLQRNAQHVQDELNRVPGYVDEVQDKVVDAYDTVTLIIRCLISDEC
ncbi:MAG TPA: hypothetical protein VG318_03120 [Actinomycetota bacterium]|nr:hypothetical protein [Actinomycetota bacterium]